MRRAQLSLSLVEAGLGVLVLVAVVTGFALGPSAADTQQAQLDVYARDAATVLSTDAGHVPRLDEVAASRDAFEQKRRALRERARAVLPAAVQFRVETPHGAVGPPAPAGPTGLARVPTANGTVAVEVWYP